MLKAHPQRETLHNEVHARPYERLTAPLALSHLAWVGAEASQAREHVAALMRSRHLPLPAEDANHLSADLGGLHLRWERLAYSSMNAWTKGSLSTLPGSPR